MSENGNHFEIERKFLIRFPDQSHLSDIGCRALQLSQIYLTRGANGESRRVRICTVDGISEYTYNEKLKLSGFTRSEQEITISAEKYFSLLSERDTSLNEIFKTRWLLPYEGHIFEIDIYPFWTDRAIMEIELKSEDEEFLLPAFIEIIREVTDDPEYLNTSLAKSIKFEKIN